MTHPLNTFALLLLSFSATPALAQPAETRLRSDWTVVLHPDAAPGQLQPLRITGPQNEVVRRVAFKTKNGCWLIGLPYEGYREECVSESISLRPRRALDGYDPAAAASRRNLPTQPSVLLVPNTAEERSLRNVVLPGR